MRGTLPCPPPTRPMVDDPVGQRLFKAHIPAGLFGFNPLVAQDFLALRLKFAIER